MISLKLTFLGSGTSQGVPMIGCCCEVCQSVDKRDKRLRSSVMVESAKTTLVVDTSMDFRFQMLRHNVSKLDAVLYTHEHKDHTGGMDDLRAFNYVMGRSIDIYCQERVRKLLHKDFDYAFAIQRYPGVPEIDVHTIDTLNPFNINDIEITPVLGYHHKMPVLGYMFDRKICYITDMNRIEQEQIDRIKGVPILIINALRHKEHISHFSLSQALEMIERIAPQRAYLTHISHQLGLYQELNPQLPDNVEMGYDKLVIEI